MDRRSARPSRSARRRALTRADRAALRIGDRGARRHVGLGGAAVRRRRRLRRGRIDLRRGHRDHRAVGAHREAGLGQPHLALGGGEHDVIAIDALDRARGAAAVSSTLAPVGDRWRWQADAAAAVRGRGRWGAVRPAARGGGRGLRDAPRSAAARKRPAAAWFRMVFMIGPSSSLFRWRRQLTALRIEQPIAERNGFIAGRQPVPVRSRRHPAAAAPGLRSGEAPVIAAAMHDIRLLRDDPAAFAAALQRRGTAFDTTSFADLDSRRRAAALAAETAQAERNRLSKEIGKAFSRGDRAAARRCRPRSPRSRTAIARRGSARRRARRAGRRAARGPAQPRCRRRARRRRRGRQRRRQAMGRGDRPRFPAQGA